MHRRGMLDVWQGFFTRRGGKGPGRTAFSA